MRNSFTYKCAQLWNKFPEDVKLADNVNIFKSKLRLIPRPLEVKNTIIFCTSIKFNLIISSLFTCGVIMPEYLLLSLTS